MTSVPADPPLLAVRDAVARALAEDVLPLGDLTASLVPAATVGRADIVAREPGVVAGRLCALEAFGQIDPTLVVTWALDDGSPVVPGSVVGTVSGTLRSILTAERTALNFVCHLSGVATTARRYVDAVAAANPATIVLDTRKTTPGLRALEKAAVRAGGGQSHRSSLSEAVLLKDNHLGVLGITEAVARARRAWPGVRVQVECDTPAQVDEAVASGADAVLLDNMDPERAAECVAAVRRTRRDVVVEASGRITVATAPLYAAAGVDAVSSGALTHSVRALDLGLDLVEG